MHCDCCAFKPMNWQKSNQIPWITPACFLLFVVFVFKSVFSAHLLADHLLLSSLLLSSCAPRVPIIVICLLNMQPSLKLLLMSCYCFSPSPPLTMTIEPVQKKTKVTGLEVIKLNVSISRQRRACGCAQLSNLQF